MKNSGYDVSMLPEDDKKKRNILIGIMIGKDPSFGKFLRNTTKSVMDYYIQLNKLKKSEILLRQYDGMFVTRKLELMHNPDFPVRLEEREFYDTFLLSNCRRMYMGLNSTRGNFFVKGIPNGDEYTHMIKFYHRLLNINFMSKTGLSGSLKYLKEEFLTSDNLDLFKIPIGGKFRIYIIDYGKIDVSKRSANMIQIDEIDKEYYFHIYLEPFFKAIVHDLF